METKNLNNIFDFLKELEQDPTVPRNIKNKINQILDILNSKEDYNIKINKALDELDEMCNDGNIQPYTRTQIWSVVSMLEECC